MVRRRLQLEKAAEWNAAVRQGQVPPSATTPGLHSALDEGSQEIRLLLLIASAGNVSSSEIVRCHLWHFSLNNFPEKEFSEVSELDWSTTEDATLRRWDSATQQQEYVALSYTWGDTSKTKLVEINGAEVRVTSNLESALRMLRDQGPIRRGCAVWADALCINQQDIVERGQQVVRMRDIYRRAQYVVIWVGEESQESPKAIALVKSLNSSIGDHSDQQLAEAVKSGTSPIQWGSWAALAMFMQRTYWNRLWILQEIAIGNNSTPIFCGRDSLTWGQLFAAIYHFTSKHIDLVFPLMELECGARLPSKGLKRNNIIQLNIQQHDQRLLEQGKVPERFLPMLDVSRKCLVSDAKDRVYGILGMMPPKLARCIRPDYAMSVAEIYASFAKSIILYRQDLLLLEQCTFAPLRGNPSWAPNWTHQDHHRLFSGKPTYNAARGGRPRISIDDQRSTLTCDGVFVGSVNGLGAAYFESDEPSHPASRITEADNTHNAYHSADGLVTAVWQMLVGNRTPQGKTAPNDYRSLLKCALRPCSAPVNSSEWRGRLAFDRLMEGNRRLKIAGRELQTFFPTAEDHSPDTTPAARDAMEQIFRMWRTKRPLITNCGHIGLGPIGMECEDSVWVLFGSTVPVVLRKVNREHFQVVGCYYLQGYMEGEAIEASAQGLLSVREVVIY